MSETFFNPDLAVKPGGDEVRTMGGLEALPVENAGGGNFDLGQFIGSAAQLAQLYPGSQNRPQYEPGLTDLRYTRSFTGGGGQGGSFYSPSGAGGVAGPPSNEIVYQQPLIQPEAQGGLNEALLAGLLGMDWTGAYNDYLRNLEAQTQDVNISNVFTPTNTFTPEFNPVYNPQTDIEVSPTISNVNTVSPNINVSQSQSQSQQQEQRQSQGDGGLDSFQDQDQVDDSFDTNDFLNYLNGLPRNTLQQIIEQVTGTTSVRPSVSVRTSTVPTSITPYTSIVGVTTVTDSFPVYDPKISDETSGGGLTDFFTEPNPVVPDSITPEEVRKAEEARQQELAAQETERQQLEAAKQAEAARQAEEARQAEAARVAEETRKAEEARVAEEARQRQLAEEAERQRQAAAEEAARQAEAQRQAEEARKAEEARQAAEAEAQRQAAARQAEEARLAEEARQRQAAEEAERQRQEAARQAEAEAQRQAAARQTVEARKAEAARKAKEAADQRLAQRLAIAASKKEYEKQKAVEAEAYAKAAPVRQAAGAKFQAEIKSASDLLDNIKKQHEAASKQGAPEEVLFNLQNARVAIEDSLAKYDVSRILKDVNYAGETAARNSFNALQKLKDPNNPVAPEVADNIISKIADSGLANVVAQNISKEGAKAILQAAGPEFIPGAAEAAAKAFEAASSKALEEGASKAAANAAGQAAAEDATREAAASLAGDIAGPAAAAIVALARGDSVGTAAAEDAKAYAVVAIAAIPVVGPYIAAAIVIDSFLSDALGYESPINEAVAGAGKNIDKALSWVGRSIGSDPIGGVVDWVGNRAIGGDPVGGVVDWVGNRAIGGDPVGAVVRAVTAPVQRATNWVRRLFNEGGIVDLGEDSMYNEYDDYGGLFGLPFEVVPDMYADQPMMFAQGGVIPLPGGGKIARGPGGGLDDLIPTSIDGRRAAALSDGEFVIPADVVSMMGDGSSNAGAKRLYDLVRQIRQDKTGTSKQAGPLQVGKILERTMR